jgi:hypothetical protein
MGTRSLDQQGDRQPMPMEKVICIRCSQDMGDDASASRCGGQMLVSLELEYGRDQCAVASM